MRADESPDVKKPRVAAIGRWRCANWLCVKRGMIRVLTRHGTRSPRGPHAAMQNVVTMDTTVNCGKVTSRVHVGVVLHIGHLAADSADQQEEIMDVSGELHEH